MENNEKPTFVSRGSTRGQRNIILEKELPKELRHKKVSAIIAEIEE
jgi:hypothetical protein